VVNTLHIADQLGRHPAAERLLRNLLIDAARTAGQPLAPLPGDWGERLRRLGYGGAG
jgi:hypothetical protein